MSWGPLGTPGRLLGSFGESLGVFLGTSGGLLRALGSFWGHLGSVSERLVGLLATSGAHPGRLLGPPGLLGRLGAILRAPLGFIEVV